MILVTHSMGGLVARSACMLHGAEQKVIGVIHGVQPAAGSPSAYWRMKAGFERPKGGPRKECWDWWRNPLKMAKYHVQGQVSAVILGTDGEEVTSLLGNSPGGLELLPNKHYRDNTGRTAWLSYPSAKGSINLPLADPYEEIYLSKNLAYRAIDPRWLNPQLAEPRKRHAYNAKRETPWDKYRIYLQDAAQFHSKLGTRCHPDTVQFYTEDLDSPDRIVFTRESRTIGPLTADCHPNVHFTNKGGCKMLVNNWEYEIDNDHNAVAVVTLELPGGKGDGTVPVSSATLLPVGKKQTIKISEYEESWFSIGHQDIFKTYRAFYLVQNAINKQLNKYIKTELKMYKV